MDIRIVGIQNKGSFSQEYVHLEVVRDCDMGRYAIADTTYNANGTVSSKLRHFHWFVDQPVKAGDTIYLYTRSGNDNSKPNNTKTVYHCFWGLKSSVWNNTGDGAVLMHLPTWSIFKF